MNYKNLSLSILMLLVSICFAETFNVPSAQHPTIQACVVDQEVSDGDSILVASGTYYETIDFLGKELTIKSVNGADETVIDAKSRLGNGADGNLSILAGETVYSDSVKSAVTDNNPAGQFYINVADASGFSVGDEILIISIQDWTTNNQNQNIAGQYETKRIIQITGNDLNLDLPLENAYNSTNQKHQVVRIPNYNNVTVTGTLTCSAWNGSTGGIIFFRATGNVNINAGSITASGKGFRGGAGATYSTGYSNPGKRGEGCFTQYNNSATSSVDMNGGGGGVYYYGSAGGGGYANNGVSGPSTNGGTGGLAVFTSNWYNRLLFGGAGGGGARYNAGASPSSSYDGGSGGNSGGIIIFHSKYFINTNTNGIITSDGSNGNNGGSYPNNGSGGGGAGGTIMIICENIINFGIIRSEGGTGGTWGYYGEAGAGSDGRIRLDYNNGQTGTNISPTPFTELGNPSDWEIHKIAFNANSNETSSCILDGFHLFGNQVVNIENSSPVIKNSKLTFSNSISEMNSRTIMGSFALNVTGGNPQFENLTIEKQINNFTEGSFRGTFVQLSNTIANFTDCLFDSLTTNLSSTATSGKGGVFYQTGGSVTFENCTFCNNNLNGASATQSVLEGGLYYLQSGSLEFSNSAFSNNHLGAVGNIPKGGLIYVHSGDAVISDCEVIGNTITSSNTPQGDFLFASASSSNITITNVNIENYSTGSEIIRFNNGGMLDLETVNITNNNCSGIFTAGNNLTINVLNSSITNNNGYGINGNCIVDLDNVIIRDNQQTGINSIVSSIDAVNSVISNNGGGLRGSGTVNVNLETCLIDSNSISSVGGGIYFSSNSSLNITDSRFKGNSSSSNNGGGIYLSGDLTLVNSEILNNSASSSGGGLFVSGIITAQNCNIENNSATDNGGGNYILGELEFQNCSTVNNTAQNGAGIYGVGDSLKIENSEINENIASNDGGGIWWKRNNDAGLFLIEHTDIFSNSATVNGGGAYLSLKDSEILLSTIAQNTAGSSGGGLYITQNSDDTISEPILQKSSFCDNTSEVLGGGLYCTYRTNMTISNSVFWGNGTSYDNFQIFMTDRSDLEVYYSDIEGGEYGGIIPAGTLIYQNSFFFDPLFLDASEFNYNLTYDSPCIDTGDPNYPVDPDGSLTDIGAHYYNQSSLPIPNFTSDVVEGFAPTTVNFTDLTIAENTTLVSWEWEFGDNSSSSLENPTHEYEEAGIYTVSLTVTDSNDSIRVHTKEDYITVISTTPGQPAPPQIQIVGIDAVLTWEEVTMSVAGFPVEVDYYLVYYSEIPDQDETFFFLGYTPDLTYTHQGVATFSDQMFYKIEAYSGSVREMTRYINRRRTDRGNQLKSNSK